MNIPSSIKKYTVLDRLVETGHIETKTLSESHDLSGGCTESYST